MKMRTDVVMAHLSGAANNGVTHLAGGAAAI